MVKLWVKNGSWNISKFGQKLWSWYCYWLVYCFLLCTVLCTVLCCVLYPLFHKGAFYKHVLLFHEIWLLLSDMLMCQGLQMQFFFFFFFTNASHWRDTFFFWFTHRNTQLWSHSWPQFLAKKWSQESSLWTSTTMGLINIHVGSSLQSPSLDVKKTFSCSARLS